MTRVTFSAERNALNFSLPTAWPELTQDELAMVMRCRARNDEPHQAKLAVLLHLTGMKIKYREDKAWVCTVPTGEKKPRKFNLDPELVPGLLDGLNWLDEPGGDPVRLDTLRGVAALPAKLHGVPFTTYLQCENCYQGILQSQKEEAVQHLGTLLYPGLKSKLDTAEQLMVIQWWAQVKTMFSTLFPNFFKPSNEGGGVPDMMEVMNNQIRALTGGDVTKEDEILNIDTWRALTELDAKAKEADEFNRKMKKK
ncbi:MAG: hypothetical protein IJ775_01000 [Muribaculaceae bacterium]|nr:hypothetical protein [Muribaculaceae bacterium]